jgi:hypothetical protein
MTLFPAIGETARRTAASGVSGVNLLATRPIPATVSSRHQHIRVSSFLEPIPPRRLLTLGVFLKRSMFMKAKTSVNSLRSGSLKAKSKDSAHPQELHQVRLTVTGSKIGLWPWIVTTSRGPILPSLGRITPCSAHSTPSWATTITKTASQFCRRD